MSLQTSPSDPSVGARRSKRLQAAAPLQTKTQPNYGAKACHRMVKPAVAISGHDTSPKDDESGSVARCSTLKPHPRCSSQGLTGEEHEEQYLDSFRTKIVALKDGTKLDRRTALEQLRRGTITIQDVEDEDGSGPLESPSDSHLPSESQDVFNDHDTHEQFSPIPPSENVFQDQSSQSEEDEQEVESGMQSEHPEDFDQVEVNHTSDAENGPAGGAADESSDSDWSDTERCRLKHEQTAREILAGNYDIDAHPSTPLDFPTSSEDTMDTEDADQYRKSKKSSRILTTASKDSDLAQEDALGVQSKLQAHRCGRLPLAAIKKAQALGMRTAREAQAIADEYGKTLASIMAAAGLTTKATRAESVWNMHQAWYAATDPKLSEEDMKDYHCRQMKHYESHKDEEEFPDLWVEIRKFWSESISGSNDMSLKGMVGRLMTCRDTFTQAAQTWCNVENIHVFGCVIYSGNDEAACQAQGIFAGSSLCMQLASERQTDIARLLDYLATIIKYKVLDSSVNVPLPTFSMLSGISYDHVLALKPLEATRDRNRRVLPLVVMHKLYKVEITRGQKNVPWKTLLDLLFTHKHTIIDWPAGVPAISRNFNVKRLTADELRALTVPFLKEQMGKDYEMEAMVDDEDNHGDFVVPVPTSSFCLEPWTADQLALVRMMNPKAFDIPLVINTFGQPQRKKDPPQWSMSIAAPLVRDVTATPLMKRTIPAGAMPTTECFLAVPPPMFFFPHSSSDILFRIYITIHHLLKDGY
ncbi:hypothetical protein EDD16DRAFT_1706870 [Pisolithus croceorrhizus]|nr:hypothetical protein EDD16DRAFT_1706870 [Pisolithus croceorrhizus]